MPFGARWSYRESGVFCDLSKWLGLGVTKVLEILLFFIRGTVVSSNLMNFGVLRYLAQAHNHDAGRLKASAHDCEAWAA